MGARGAFTLVSGETGSSEDFARRGRGGRTAGWPGHALHAFHVVCECATGAAFHTEPFETNVTTMPPGGAGGGPTGTLRLGREGLCILKLLNSPLLPHHPPESG